MKAAKRVSEIKHPKPTELEEIQKELDMWLADPFSFFKLQKKGEVKYLT